MKLISKNNFIPVNVPKIFKQEKKYVKKCLDSGWISSEGKFVKQFEEEVALICNRKYGISNTNSYI